MKQEQQERDVRRRLYARLVSNQQLHTIGNFSDQTKENISAREIEQTDRTHTTVDIKEQIAEKRRALRDFKSYYMVSR